MAKWRVSHLLTKVKVSHVDFMDDSEIVKNICLKLGNAWTHGSLLPRLKEHIILIRRTVSLLVLNFEITSY